MSLMDDKQLNYFQPLLSVRRSPSTLSSEKDARKKDHPTSKIPPLPSYKSELKSGPIRHAGTVPFVWERSPGRPKDENIQQKLAAERPPIAPKLPPGRILKITNEDSDKYPEHPSLSKRHGEVLNGSLSVSAPYQNVNEVESSVDTVDAESSVSEDGDEAYMDALDTLSRAESTFMNCSLSGVDDRGVMTSGSFSTDPQTRDFMMGRFLPAARAMVSETPQYAPKKQPIVREQPRQLTKVTSMDKRSPLRYEFNDISHYVQENDEESDDDHYGHRQFPAKICGALPRFFIKNSFCLLNPVPATSVRTRVPMSPPSSRTHGSSSSTGSSCETENEVQSDQLSCPFTPKKLEGSSLYRRLQGRGLPSTHDELPQSAFSKQKELPQAKDSGVTVYCSTEKGGSTIENLSFDPRSQGQADTGSPMIEKTLHVDIVHKVESPDNYSYITGEDDLKDLLKWKVMETSLEDAPSDKPKNQNVEDEEADSKIFCHKVVDLSLQSVADESYQVLVMDTLKGSEQNTELPDNLKNFAKAPPQVNTVLETEESSKAEDIEKSNGSREFPVPPPLPKSPSDSWLWRTLPSKSLKTPASKSHLGTPRNQAFKTNARLMT